MESIKCAIGRVNKEDNSIAAIFCAGDGGLEYTGALLYTNYNSPDLANSLVSMGDIRHLEQELKDCVAIGEGAICEPIIYDTEQEYRDNAKKDFMAPIIYLFDNEWLYCDVANGEHTFIPINETEDSQEDSIEISDEYFEDDDVSDYLQTL